MDADQVLDFWFVALQPRDWFRRADEVDARIRQQFADVHRAAAAGELFAWRQSAEGRLAEILLLDQFSRNLYRDDPRAFACDTTALVLAQEAMTAGAEAALTSDQRVFLYMPFMHSESRVIQRQSLRLYGALGKAENLDFARRHADIIERFGRYPHRNSVLGRHSTPQEQEFLRQPGSSF